MDSDVLHLDSNAHTHVKQPSATRGNAGNNRKHERFGSFGAEFLLLAAKIIVLIRIIVVIHNRLLLGRTGRPNPQPFGVTDKHRIQLIRSPQTRTFPDVH
jgi:hypothetical protein